MSQLRDYIQSYDIRLTRLKASLKAYRYLLNSRMQRADIKGEKLAIVNEAHRLLDMAEECGSRAVSEGWRYFFEAYQLGVHLYNNAELEAEVTSLRSELSKKLNMSWRGEAALTLLKLRCGDEQPPSVEHLIKALEIRDEYFANKYLKIDLVRRQLEWLAGLLLILLSIIVYWILLFYGGIFPCMDMSGCSVQNFGLFFLFGMLGGAMTTCLSIIRTPSSKSPIPEQMLNKYITLARPLIGGTAAVIVMLAIHAKILPVAFGGDGGAGRLLLAFAAGFSEQLIMGAMGKAVGKE